MWLCIPRRAGKQWQIRPAPGPTGPHSGGHPGLLETKTRGAQELLVSLAHSLGPGTDRSRSGGGRSADGPSQSTPRWRSWAPEQGQRAELLLPEDGTKALPGGTRATKHRPEQYRNNCDRRTVPSATLGHARRQPLEWKESSSHGSQEVLSSPPETKQWTAHLGHMCNQENARIHAAHSHVCPRPSQLRTGQFGKDTP